MNYLKLHLVNVHSLLMENIWHLSINIDLIIRSSTTLEIINLFACIDTIETIEWSYDSRFILAGLIKRNAVQIFSLDNPEWKW